MSRVYECPVCGPVSDTCYRCSECGRDLAAESKTQGQIDV